MSNKLSWHSSLRLWILTLLFVGSMVNYTDRSVLGVVMPQVRRGLSLTNAHYALAVHAFLVMYALFYILGGRIADRLGYRRTFSVAVLFWTAAMAAHSFVQGLRSLFFCQAALGMGEGSYYPTAMKGIAGLFPPASRAKAVGAILSAISFGLLVTPPLVAWVTLRFGWRVTFLLFGLLGTLLVPPWLWVHRQTERNAAFTDAPTGEAGAITAGADAKEEVTLGEALKSRKYLCVLAARACSDTAWYFYLFWIPGYFQDVRGLSLATVGKLLWVPYAGACVGPLTGAAASGTLIGRGWSMHRSRLTVMLVFASVCVFSASGGFAPTTILALGLVTLALFSHQALSTNIHTVVTEIVPPKHVAILYGMTGAAGTFIGAAAQLVIGPVIDHYGYKPAFVWAGGMYALAIGLLLSAGVLEPIRRSALLRSKR